MNMYPEKGIEREIKLLVASLRTRRDENIVYLRDEAYKQLKGYGRQALPQLIDTLKDVSRGRNIRRWCAKLIGEIGEVSEVGVLSEYCNDEVRAVSKASYEALCKVIQKLSFEKLNELLISNQSIHFKEAIRLEKNRREWEKIRAEENRRTEGEKKAEETSREEESKRKEEFKNFKTRVLCFIEQNETGAYIKAIKALYQRIVRLKKYRRYYTLNTFVIEYVTIIALVKKIDEIEPQQNSYYLNLLFSILKDELFYKSLDEYLSCINADADLTIQIIEALTIIGDPIAREVIVPCVNDKDERVRIATEKALEHFRKVE